MFETRTSFSSTTDRKCIPEQLLNEVSENGRARAKNAVSNKADARYKNSAGSQQHGWTTKGQDSRGYQSGGSGNGRFGAGQSWQQQPPKPPGAPKSSWKR